MFDALVFPASHFDIIFGKPWFNRHNPQIDWPSNSVTISKIVLPGLTPPLVQYYRSIPAAPAPPVATKMLRLKAR
jgi:hypothetical protein